MLDTLPGLGAPERYAAIYPLVPTRSFDEPLTYSVPGELELGAQVEVGSIVEVTIGNAPRVGVVAQLDVEPPPRVKLKPILRVLDMHRVPPSLIALAEWIAEQYGCPVTVAISLVIGPQLSGQAKAVDVPIRKQQQAVRRIVDDLSGVDLTKRQREIAEKIPRAWVTVADAATNFSTTRATLGKLAEAGVLQLDSVFLEEVEAHSPKWQARIEMAADYEAEVERIASSGSKVELTKAQIDCVEKAAGIAADDGLGAASLLVGSTGSGKTEVYLEAIAHVLAQGRSAIALVPEIALTPQTARRFTERFPGLVAVLHSGMTKRERSDAHEAIASGIARVVVGPRSAIFAPVSNLGIIVIDEEHDSSYKQDSEPRYDARRVAFRRALNEDARIIFGSATPRPESWMGIKRRLVMKERPGGGRLAPVELIDIRDDEDSFPLTNAVSDALRETLSRGFKAIILHNRRGFAPALHCRGCSRGFRCPNCDVSRVIHGTVSRRQRLTCHHCGYDTPVPTTCPECHSADIIKLGTGTEQLEQILEHTFGVPIFRLDADAVKTRGSVGKILGQFSAAGPSLLVGTQMVAKGHDFGDVELAVVIDADAAMSIPDFRCEERAFALVAQLAGRAGRSAKTAENARVLIQTRVPEHPVMDFVRDHNVEGFLARELDEREQHGFPPYNRFVRIVISARDERDVATWSSAIANGLRKLGAGEVEGPASLLRINDRMRAHILVKTQQVSAYARAVRSFLQTSERDRKHSDVRVHLDVDPQSLM